MYFAEKLMYQDQTKDGDGKQHWEKMAQDFGIDAELIRTTGKDATGEKYYRIEDSVSDMPDMDQSLYSYNDRYLDVRTPMDDKRGLLTILALPFALTSFGFLSSFLEMFYLTVFKRVNIQGGLLEAGDIFMTIFLGITSIPLAAAFIFFANKVLRLESLVQRRLLIRFDRSNRLVYLHRPRYAGGVVSLDWDKVTTAFDGKDEGSVGIPLILLWYPQDTPNGLWEMVMVGRLAHSDIEIRQRWEFIRRFMQDGPASLPANPKTIGRFPWPWRSIQTTLGLVWPIFRMSSLRWAIPLLILISPIMLIFAIGNWLSQLLCWEPVFPRAIRQACGESWLSVLQTRLIDVGSLAMLGGVIWWHWGEQLQSLFSTI
jgi:hypothetical protein